MRLTGKVSLFGSGPREPDLPAIEGVRSAVRAAEGHSSVDDHGVAENHLTRADAIGAWVCAIGIVAAILLVVVLAARN
jgi:cell division protein FtsX